MGSLNSEGLNVYISLNTASISGATAGQELDIAGDDIAGHDVIAVLNNVVSGTVVSLTAQVQTATDAAFSSPTTVVSFSGFLTASRVQAIRVPLEQSTTEQFLRINISAVDNTGGGSQTATGFFVARKKNHGALAAEILT